MIRRLFKNFFTSGMVFEDVISYRRVILVNLILSITVLVFYFFAIFNLWLDEHVVAGLDLFAGSISLFTLVYLRRSHNLFISGMIASINFSLFFIMFIFVNHAAHTGIIWSIFIPIFTILVNGRKLGLLISLTFYFLLFTQAFLGIDVWQEGLWNIKDFIRLVFASIVLTYIVYVNEYALEETDAELARVRKLEKEHILELKKMSITDPLTDIYNRRHFNELGQKLFAMAKRKHETFCFFILDIDFFKLYNDNYGHKKGDEILIKVAQMIKSHIQRDDDFVFRLGGEEFAGVLQTTNVKDAAAHICKLCTMIEELHIPHEYSTVSEYLTVSIGIKITKLKAECTLEDIYKEADKALYEAKFRGKNRCVVSKDEV